MVVGDIVTIRDFSWAYTLPSKDLITKDIDRNKRRYKIISTNCKLPLGRGCSLAPHQHNEIILQQIDDPTIVIFTIPKYVTVIKDCPEFVIPESSEEILKWADAKVSLDHNQWTLLWFDGKITLLKDSVLYHYAEKQAKVASALYIYLRCKDVSFNTSIHLIESYIHYSGDL